MNTVVVYDSQFGNTEQIAQRIAEAMRAFGRAQAIRVDPSGAVELQGVDMLILGCPTQAFRPTPAMQSFLENAFYPRLRTLAVACFDTRVPGPFGSAARSMVRRLRMKGVTPIAPAENFIVQGKTGPLATGETTHAATWATDLHTQFERTQSHQNEK